MAFVVARCDGRFEIRESVATPRGPRATTLATFRVLDDGVLDRAQARATTPFDRQTVAARAKKAGAPADERAAARSGWRLLAELNAGHTLPPVLAGAIATRLGPARATLPDTLPPLLDWIGVSLAERGEALRDLLRLADRLPQRRAAPGRPFPRIASGSR